MLRAVRDMQIPAVSRKSNLQFSYQCNISTSESCIVICLTLKNTFIYIKSTQNEFENTVVSPYTFLLQFFESMQVNCCLLFSRAVFFCNCFQTSTVSFQLRTQCGNITYYLATGALWIMRLKGAKSRHFIQNFFFPGVLKELREKLATLDHRDFFTLGE